MLRKKDCCGCGDWNSQIRELWEKYQNAVRTIKFNGTTSYPDGDGQVTINYSPDLSGYVTDAELATELATKQDTLVSGTNIKTINGNSLLGSGNIVISGGSGDWGSIGGDITDQADLMAILDDNIVSMNVMYGLSDSNVTEPSDLLPIGYKELAYLETNQQGGIKTDYYFKSGDTIEVSCHPVSGWTGNSMIYGATNPSNKWNMLNQYGNGYEWYLDGSSLGNAGANVKDVDTVFKAQLKSANNRLFRDGVQLVYNNTKTHDITMSTPMSFMQLTQPDGTTSDYFKGKLYWAKIYDSNDNLIHHYIPAMNESDSSVGLYDIINNSFYAANGTVTYGSKSSAYSEDCIQPTESLPYLWSYIRYQLYDGTILNTRHTIIQEYTIPSASLTVTTYGA